MGAAAFVMAETLGVQYPVIIKAAVLPALIYYLGIILQVQMRATKDHLNGIPKEWGGSLSRIRPFALWRAAPHYRFKFNPLEKGPQVS